MFLLRFFGGACILGPGGPVGGAVVQRRRLALLALLAASPGHRMGRERLAAYLWQDADSERARASVVDAVYALRRALGREALVSRGDELWLDPARIESDVAAFASALAAGEHERAVDLYSGAFLDGFYVPDAPLFEAWVEAERQRLGAEYARTLERLASLRAAAGDAVSAAEAWERLATHDPYCSRVIVGAMGALAAAGDRAAAIRCAQLHRRLLREELGAEPDREILDLERRLHGEPGRPQPYPVHGRPAEVRFAHPPRAAGPDDRLAEDHLDPRTSAGPPPAEPVTPPVRVPPSRRAWKLGGLTLSAVVALWVVVTSPDRVPGDPERGSHSLVVLPFVDLSPEGNHEYFSDGLTDELTHTLARVDGLRVVARTSAFTFKGRTVPVNQVARQLRVDHVLEGSVRRNGERVRISAQLIDARSGFPLWTGVFDRELSDIFAVQLAISDAIARSMELELGAGRALGPGTSDPEAYDLYLQGRYHWNLGSVVDATTQQRALEFFERAVQHDPGFAAAHAGIADAHSHAGRPLLAKAAALRAIALDSTRAEGRIALAYPLAFHEWRWGEAEHELSRALELDPGSVLAYLRRANVRSARGRHDEAIADVERAARLEPLSFLVSYNRGLVYYWAGRYDEAVRYLRHTLAMDTSRADVRRELAHALFGRGDMPDAAALYRSTGDTLYALLATGSPEQWERAVRWAEAHPEGMSPTAQAHFYARLGLPDQAFAALQVAVQERDRWIPFHLRFPALEPLRADPEFSRLRTRMGLQ
jgi:TolB-like protein/DNA-binding SARP family transcriptional activator/Tfp pilus assembly protein PilF